MKRRNKKIINDLKDFEKIKSVIGISYMNLAKVWIKSIFWMIAGAGTGILFNLVMQYIYSVKGVSSHPSGIEEEIYWFNQETPRFFDTYFIEPLNKFDLILSENIIFRAWFLFITFFLIYKIFRSYHKKLKFNFFQVTGLENLLLFATGFLLFFRIIGVDFDTYVFDNVQNKLNIPILNLFKDHSIIKNYVPIDWTFHYSFKNFSFDHYFLFTYYLFLLILSIRCTFLFSAFMGLIKRIGRFIISKNINKIIRNSLLIFGASYFIFFVFLAINLIISSIWLNPNYIVFTPILCLILYLLIVQLFVLVKLSNNRLLKKFTDIEDSKFDGLRRAMGFVSLIGFDTLVFLGIFLLYTTFVNIWGIENQWLIISIIIISICTFIIWFIFYDLLRWKGWVGIGILGWGLLLTGIFILAVIIIIGAISVWTNDISLKDHYVWIGWIFFILYLILIFQLGVIKLFKEIKKAHIALIPGSNIYREEIDDIEDLIYWNDLYLCGEKENFLYTLDLLDNSRQFYAKDKAFCLIIKSNSNTKSQNFMYLLKTLKGNSFKSNRRKNLVFYESNIKKFTSFLPQLFNKGKNFIFEIDLSEQKNDIENKIKALYLENIKKEVSPKIYKYFDKYLSAQGSKSKLKMKLKNSLRKSDTNILFIIKNIDLAATKEIQEVFSFLGKLKDFPGIVFIIDTRDTISSSFNRSLNQLFINRTKLIEFSFLNQKTLKNFINFHLKRYLYYRYAIIDGVIKINPDNADIHSDKIYDLNHFNSFIEALQEKIILDSTRKKLETYINQTSRNKRNGYNKDFSLSFLMNLFKEMNLENKLLDIKIKNPYVLKESTRRIIYLIMTEESKFLVKIEKEVRILLKTIRALRFKKNHVSNSIKNWLIMEYVDTDAVIEILDDLILEEFPLLEYEKNEEELRKIISKNLK